MGLFKKLGFKGGAGSAVATPVSAVDQPSVSSEKKVVSLEKSKVCLDKTLVNLSKSGGVDLTKHQARVGMVLDYSGVWKICMLPGLCSV